MRGRQGVDFDFDPEGVMLSFEENVVGMAPCRAIRPRTLGGHLQIGDLIARNFARRLMLGRIGSAIIAGDGVGHPRERLLLLGIKGIEDRADQQRMRGLLPMVAPLEHAFGVDQDAGDILHIAHVIGQVGNDGFVPIPANRYRTTGW